MRAYDSLDFRFYITKIVIQPGLEVWRIVDSTTDLWVKDGKGSVAEFLTKTAAKEARDTMNTRVMVTV